MPLEISLNEILDGGSFPTRTDRILTGLSFGLPVPGPTGPLTGAAVLNPGAGYTSIPAATAGGVGTGAVVTVAMGIATMAAAPVAAGSSYAPNDTITLVGGTASQQAILHVQTTTLVSAPAVAAGGTGYAVNDTITLQGGAVVKVATVTSGAVATITLQAGGSFTANNTAAGGLTQQSTSGTGTGATFTGALANYGIASFSILNNGSYTVLPANPVAQGSTSGAGSGATFTVNTWQIASLSIAAGKGGNNYRNGTPITLSGGGATTQGTGVGTTNLIGQPVNFSVTGFQNLPASYIVNFDTDAPCNASFNAKTVTGFNVTLTPIAPSQPVLATTMNIQVQG